MLVTKDNYEANEIVRVIHPKKKPANQLVSLEQAVENKNIYSNRIVVKNFFRRMCSLRAVMGIKYRWKFDW